MGASAERLAGRRSGDGAAALKLEVERWLREAYVAAEGAEVGLRDEDRKKAAEVTALIQEIGRFVGTTGKPKPIVLVDAAAGHGYVGLLAAKLVLGPVGRRVRVAAIERDPRHAGACARAALRLGLADDVDVRVGDLAVPSLWPERPDLVVALHACGAASDAVIDRAVGSEARRLLLVPCCYGAGVPAEAMAAGMAGALGIPRHAPVRRRFAQAIVDAERTLRLEAAGWQTEVVEFVSPTITPHNLLWRARHVGEAGRMHGAAQALEQLRSLGVHGGA